MPTKQQANWSQQLKTRSLAVCLTEPQDTWPLLTAPNPTDSLLPYHIAHEKDFAPIFSNSLWSENFFLKKKIFVRASSCCSSPTGYGLMDTIVLLSPRGRNPKTRRGTEWEIWEFEKWPICPDLPALSSSCCWLAKPHQTKKK